MIKDIDLCLSPQEAYEKELLRKRCAAKCGVKAKDVTSAVYLKKSVDSRRKDIKVNARVRVFIDEVLSVLDLQDFLRPSRCLRRGLNRC